MKLVIYLDDRVADIIHNVNDLKVVDNKLVWTDGILEGVPNDYCLVDDNRDPETISPEERLQTRRDIKTNELREKCSETIYSGFTSATTGHKYSLAEHDQRNFNMQAIILLQDQSITTVAWHTDDSGTIDHTRDEFLAVFKEGYQYIQENINKYRQLKEQVKNAQSGAEIDSIEWT